MVDFLVRVAQRHSGVALQVAAILLVGSVVPAYAQTAPAPLVSFIDAIVWTLLYVVCPAGGIWLLISGIFAVSQGHHGAGSGAFLKFGCALALFCITGIASWFQSFS
jgi:hypothetical protein